MEMHAVRESSFNESHDNQNARLLSLKVKSYIITLFEQSLGFSF